MILLMSSQNRDLRCVRIKRRSELSGYELTGVDCNRIRLTRWVLWLQPVTGVGCHCGHTHDAPLEVGEEHATGLGPHLGRGPPGTDGEADVGALLLVDELSAHRVRQSEL